MTEQPARRNVALSTCGTTLLTSRHLSPPPELLRETTNLRAEQLSPEAQRTIEQLVDSRWESRERRFVPSD